MDDLSKYASLERYVLTRGRNLVSPAPSLKGLNIQLGVGLTLMVISTIMLVAGLMASIRGLIFGAIGPMIAGVVNVVVASGLKLAFRRPQVQAPEISREARAMLSRLSWTFIWSKNPWVYGMQMPQTDPTQAWQAEYGGRAHHHYGHYHHAWRHSLSRGRQSEIPADVLQQMDVAASHFNRIAGALEAGGTAGAIQRLRPKIVQAADEAMIDVLHQAQLASQFPEGIKAIQGRLTAGLSTLSELGDRVEALTLREPTFTDMLVRRTTADEVLEELRLEQSALNELSSQPDEGPRNHLQT